MRIVAIRDIVSPIRSNIANAYIDFSQMTALGRGGGHRPQGRGASRWSATASIPTAAMPSMAS